MWMSPYYNKNIGIWMTSYVIPLYDAQGDAVGVTGMDLDFTKVMHLVEEAQVYGEDSSAALFDKSGNLLHGRDYRLSLNDDNVEALKETNANLSDDERQAIAGLYEASKNSLDSGEAARCQWGGDEYRVVGHLLNNGMMLAAMVPESTIQAPIWTHLGWCAAIALVIMLLASVLAAGITRTITRPLENLASASHEISQGNLDVRIEAASKDEVGQLAASFQKMAGDLRERMAQIQDMAYLDPLTGLGNRAAYMDAVKELDERISQGEARFTLAVMDLNGLKRANDQYGHEAGDELIADAARAISRAFGKQRCFRYGGDEFAAIVRDDTHDANYWGGRLEEEVAAANAANAAADGSVARSYASQLSIAWGVAAYDPAKHSAFSDAFKDADASMYQRKTER